MLTGQFSETWVHCDQIERFIGLWATFQSLWQQLICPNLLNSQEIFVKVILNFWENHFGHLLMTFGKKNSGRTDLDHHLQGLIISGFGGRMHRRQLLRRFRIRCERVWWSSELEQDPRTRQTRWGSGFNTSKLLLSITHTCSRCYKTFFWGNLDFPKLRYWIKFVPMSEPALKCENNAIFKQNYTPKLCISFKISYSCCFGLRGNLSTAGPLLRTQTDTFPYKVSKCLLV